LSKHAIISGIEDERPLLLQLVCSWVLAKVEVAGIFAPTHFGSGRVAKPPPLERRSTRTLHSMHHKPGNLRAALNGAKVSSPSGPGRMIMDLGHSIHEVASADEVIE
jgi:hypothetical protein